jgi:hypothetical protein
MSRIMCVVAALGVLVAGCARDVRADGAVQSNAPVVQGAPSRLSDAGPGGASVNVAEPKYREVVIPAGTKLGVRLNTSVGSATSHVEQPVDATLVSPLRLDGVPVLPAGSHFEGIVSAAQRSGKVKGRAHVALRFTRLAARDESYPIAAQISRVAPATKKEDAEKIGIPAAGGAIVGALIDGKKGAAIGAAAGGGAGTAVVLATAGKEVSLPKGSVLSLRLEKAVRVKVPID